jgi:transposase
LGRRRQLARLVVDEGWPPSRAAEFFHVSWRTAAKWAQRYRDEGPAGMVDRSSARHTQHAKTPGPVVRKIVHLRWKQRLGPVPIAAKLGMPASTVHAVLNRCRLNRLTHLDRVTGDPARRYQGERPGELIQVDVKKLGYRLVTLVRCRRRGPLIIDAATRANSANFFDTCEAGNNRHPYRGRRTSGSTRAADLDGTRSNDGGR